MHVCLVTPNFSREFGGAVRNYEIARALSRKGVKVTVLTPTYESNEDDCEQINVIKYRRNRSSIRYFGQVALNINPFLFLKLRAVLRHFDIDMVQLEHPNDILPVGLALPSNIPLILDEHNCHFTLTKEVGLGLFSQIHSFFLENMAIKRADKILAVSQEDKQDLIKYHKAEAKKLYIIPNGVNLERFKAKKYTKGEENIILFMGDLRHRPNQEAVKIIVSQLLPKLEKKVSKRFVVEIVGKNPFSWLKDKEKALAFLKIIGFVKDVRPYICRATVAIAPIQSGSGTRIKILEYMAMGKPVVSTPKGAEGLEVNDGEDILLAQDWDVFVDHIKRILENPEFGDWLGRNAKKLVERKYNWDAIVERLIQMYNSF